MCVFPLLLQCDPEYYDFNEMEEKDLWKECCEGAAQQYIRDKDCEDPKYKFR